MERDALFEKAEAKQDISTHTLTWSVTRYVSIIYITIIISTHTLTWSVTQ